jgi:hypothetical protein
MIYIFTKTPLDVERLQNEIHSSAITKALESVTALASEVTITFKEALPDNDIIILNNLVNAHTGEPLEVPPPQIEVTSLPEPQPFAVPSYRTKRTAVDNIAQCSAGQETTIDYRITEERYIHGGCLFGKNVELGDYVTADLMDLDGVIPEPYRPLLCENWPLIARYIEKEFVAPCGQHVIDTYPLNAKITVGLYLRITYHAINIGQPREIAVNYYLTKKL